jgi:hypothetical protein
VLGNRKKNKRARNDMSDFASAEDYEDTMEEIIQMHALKSGASTGGAGIDDANAMTGTKKANAKSSVGGGKGKGKANVKDTKAGDTKSAATRKPLKKGQKK